MRFLLVALLIVSCRSVAAQQGTARSLFQSASHLYERSLQEEDESASDTLARKSLEQYRQLRGSNLLASLAPLDQARASTRAGELAQYFGEEGDALRWYQQVLALRTVPDSLYFRPYIFCGIISYGRSRLDSARWYFAKAASIQAKSARPLPDAQRLYNNMGALLFESGNYRQAQNYFEQALALLPRSHPAYRDLYVNYQSNLAAIQIRLGEYDAAIGRYKSLLSYSVQLPEIRNNIGIAYLRKGKAAEALRWLNQVVYPDARAAGTWNDRAEAWMQLNDRPKVLECLSKAREVTAHFFGTRPSSESGRTQRLRGDLYSRSGDTAAALASYQEALHQYHPLFTYRRITDNPKDFNGLLAYLPVYEALIAKAELLSRYPVKAPNWDAALDCWVAAFALTDFVSRSYDNDEARLFLQKTKYRVHGRPIDVAFARYRATGNPHYLEQAFAFDQQNKASVQALSEHEARLERNDPDGRRLQDIRASISRLQLQLYRATAGGQEALRARIRTMEIEAGQLRAAQRQRHPGTADSLPSLSQVRTVLGADTRLLSYHFSAGYLTVFLLTKDRFEGKQVALYKGFEPDLQDFATALRSQRSPATAAAARLYSFLLEPFLGREQRLVILPDDELLYLPFEALPLREGFVATHLVVQYGANTSLLRREARGAFGPVLAFAPFAHAGSDNGSHAFARLPASQEEIAGVDGTTFLDSAATKDRFLSEAARFPVLHLATHAVSNDSVPLRSFIAFGAGDEREDDALLYASEVYQLELRGNRLLILSACETGDGSLQRGEGLLSLGRAFAYAGCRNRITSLWKADDVSTADIIQRMYAFIGDGYDPGAALQRAKAAYLADPKVHPRRKLPAFWAHLVYSGGVPAPKARHWGWWFAGDLLLILAALLLFLQRRKRLVTLQASAPS